MRRLFLFLFSLNLLAAGCGAPIFQCSYIERQRLTSSDGAIDAIIIEGDCGATTSISTMVYMAPAGFVFDEIKRDFDPSRTVFRADSDSLDDFKFDWNERVFEISYEKVRIFSFTNFGEIREPDGSTRQFEVRLVQSKFK